MLADGELKARVEVMDDVVRVGWKPAADDHDNREASAGVGNDVYLPPCNDNTYEDVIPAPRRESQGGEEERGGSAMRSRRNLNCVH